MGDDTVIVLTDEEGNESEWDIVQVICLDHNHYALLLPHTEEEPDESVILRIEEDDGEEGVLVEIEDEEEFERVAEAFETFLDDDEEDDE